MNTSTFMQACGMKLLRKKDNPDYKVREFSLTFANSPILFHDLE